MGDTTGFLAITAAVAALLSSVLIFHPDLRSALAPEISIVAPVWAMITVNPSLSTTVNFARKSIVSAVVGAIPACLLASVPSPFRFTMVVLSFPLPFLYAASDPACSNPLQQLMIAPGAILVHYATLGFGPDDTFLCWKVAAEFALVFSVGSVSGVLAHLLVTAVLRRRDSFCISEVDASLRGCLEQLLFTAEGTLMYLFTGSMHRKEISERIQTLRQCIVSYEASVGAWDAEWWSDKPKKEALAELRSRLAGAYAVQTGLLETFEDGYSDRYKQLLWEPVSLELEGLRLCIVASLRKMTAWSRGGADAEESAAVLESIQTLKEASDKFHEAVHNNRLRRCSEDVVDAQGVRHMSANEVVRAMSATLTLERFPSLVSELFEALEAAGIRDLAHKPPTSSLLVRSSFQQARAFFADAGDHSKYFVANPAEAILERGSPSHFKARARRFLKYPFRLALASHIAAIGLIAVGHELPYVKQYAVWVLLPCIICFLPTTGAGLQKSARRFVGTLFGSAVALGCVYWNPRNPPALISELLIVTFAGKYASTFPSIGYGGLVFGLTWDVVVLGTWNSAISESFNGLVFALMRCGMTLAGVCLTVAFSLVLFPNHATTHFERLCAEALLCTTEVCVITSRVLLSKSESGECNLSPVMAERTSIVFEELPEQSPDDAYVAELEFSVRSGITGRVVLLQEAEAERWLVPRVFRDLQALQESSEKLANVAAALWRNSAVFDGEGGVRCMDLFTSAPKHGPVLRLSIRRMQEVLRQAALGLANQLRRVRTPGVVVSRQKLQHSLEALEYDFAMTRQEVYENGSMLALMSGCLDGSLNGSGGLDALYMAIYGLCKFATVWLKTEALLSSEEPKADEGVVSRPPSLDSLEEGIVPMCSPIGMCELEDDFGSSVVTSSTSSELN